MNFKRTSGVLFLLIAGGVGCNAYPTLKNLPLDCSVEGAYVFQTVDNFETVGMAGLWTSGDTATPDLSVDVEAMTDGSRCGSTAALVIRSRHNNDWGSLFGFNNFGGPAGRDESMYEGMSFWARAPGNTTKGFTILMDDPNTASSTISYCTLYGTDAGTSGPTTTIYDPSTGMAISGTTTAAPPPDACGNQYSTTVTLTADWQLYTLPFGNFKQAPTPNRVPNSALKVTGPVPETGLLISAILNLTLRMPKEADMELWLDNLSFYRKKGVGVGNDGGNDGGADAR